jgi:hypothetical protein
LLLKKETQHCIKAMMTTGSLFRGEGLHTQNENTKDSFQNENPKSRHSWIESSLCSIGKSRM